MRRRERITGNENSAADRGLIAVGVSPRSPAEVRKRSRRTAIAPCSSTRRKTGPDPGPGREGPGHGNGGRLRDRKIVRPDLKKAWQFRPSTRRTFESAWAPTDEAIPGYPRRPASTRGVRRSLRRRDRAVRRPTHGPTPASDSADASVRDVATIGGRFATSNVSSSASSTRRKTAGTEYQHFTDTQLLDV